MRSCTQCFSGQTHVAPLTVSHAQPTMTIPLAPTLNTTSVGPAPTPSNSTGFENSATKNSLPMATDTIHNVASHTVETVQPMNTLASQDVIQTTPNVHIETTPIVNVEPNDVTAGEKTNDVVMGAPVTATLKPSYWG